MKNHEEKLLREKLSDSLRKKRYEHSLGVCEESVRMAKEFGADRDKAFVAGLLHDCAKCLRKAETDELIKKYDIELDSMTKQCEPVMHAPLGAVVAEHEYGIKDAEILDAIRYHTVARKGMSLLEKIVYVADMTEPHRDYPGVDELRKASKKDIDEAYAIAVKCSLIHNINKGSVIHPNTLEAWNDICEGGKGK